MANNQPSKKNQNKLIEYLNKIKIKKEVDKLDYDTTKKDNKE